jgi:hypothetical protein
MVMLMLMVMLTVGGSGVEGFHWEEKEGERERDGETWQLVESSEYGVLGVVRLP